MAFQGEILSVTEMIRLAELAPPAPRSSAGVLHTAVGAARDAAELVDAGEPATAGWRFGVLQALDDYTSTCLRGGTELGAQVFTEPPAPTGSVELDAAFAALADYLAERGRLGSPALDPRCVADREARPVVGVDAQHLPPDRARGEPSRVPRPRHLDHAQRARPGMTTS